MIERILKRMTVFCCTLLLCLSTIFGNGITLLASAEESLQSAYEQSNVMENLQGATIGGKPFDLADYPEDENGSLQLLSFVEFGYTQDESKQSDFGLYVYLYNPQLLPVEVENERNKIAFAYGENTQYNKYDLVFLNEGESGRFQKFKVNLSDEQRHGMLGMGQERVYKVSGIELSTDGIVTEYTCAQSYTYTGFAEGYGDEPLICKVDGFEKYLTLDVRSTYYRPQGTNGSGYTQDTLHSVYFSVPNALIKEYGDMTAIHATWLNAKTNPMLVTGNKDVYDAVLPYIGEEVDGGDFTYAKDDKSPLDYAFIASKYIESASWNNASYGQSYLSYNENRHYTKSDARLTKLHYAFYAENGDADKYILPAERLIDGTDGYFREYTNTYGGELVNGKYSKELFAEVADSMTDITLSKDDAFSLTDEVISQTLWQKFVGGGYEVSSTNSYTMSAIKKVQDSDFGWNKTDTCNALYIDESDYTEFKSYYDSAKLKDETVYLFRYYQSAYTAYEVVEYKRSEGDWTLFGTQFGYEYVDTNAYFLQMWVQLDFDVIDLTFTKDNVAMVIPVVQSPKDLAADGTPPVITNPEPLEWWQILLAILALVLIVILIIKLGFKLIWWILCLPFRFIWWLIKLIFKKKEGGDAKTGY